MMNQISINTVRDINKISTQVVIIPLTGTLEIIHPSPTDLSNYR